MVKTDKDWYGSLAVYDQPFDQTKWDKLLKNYDLHCHKIIKAAVVDIGESAKAKSERIAWLEQDYVRWFEYYFHRYAKVQCAPFHHVFADKIISSRKSKTQGKIYRSGAKSVHANVGVSMFLYVTEHLKGIQTHFHLLIGETETKAKRLLGDIQSEFEYNQRFINDYGRKVSKGTWSDGDFMTTDGARFVALGFGQSPRGIREGAERPTYISIDDVDTKKHVNNNVIMQDGVDYITGEVMGCFDASDYSTERMVYVNNDFHKNSITHRLEAWFNKAIQIDQRNKRKSNYYVLVVCAVTDLKTFTPTWPAKATSGYWREKYEKDESAFLREYMHQHVEKGKKFKAEYMQWKEMLPLDQYDALLCVGDLSYKAQGDFKAFFLMGKAKREIHFIHTFCRQSDRSEVAEWLYNLYEDKKLHIYNIRFFFDGLFAQDQFTNDFDAEGEVRGYYIPVEPNVKSYGDKANHIESVLGFFKRLWVFWNIEEKEHADQIEAIEQHLKFEKGSTANDDAPDGGAVGIKELNIATFVESFDPRIIARENYVSSEY
jgi:hypothetical protein